MHRARIMHKLGVTYHVGEDFRDLASGLRAVDEALTFLELQRGDRLGHALALGVDPDIHYATKNRTVLLSRQDRLDDLVWLLMRAKEFDVPIPHTLRLKMEQDAEKLLVAIYGTQRWRYSLQEYWQAWYLRGDHPDSYRFGPPVERNTWVKCGASQLQYEQFCLSHQHEAEQGRQVRQLADLYRRYQFGYAEKKRGNQVQPVPITDSYISFLREMQDRMLDKVLERGVVIECNPSSNVKIGTFGRYDRHPIFRFYDVNPANTRGRQLSVSINTDDLGVFDTSLEMEYALLAECMAAQPEPDGSKRYSEEVIYNYLDTLRRLSWTQCFEPPAMPLNQRASTLRRWEKREVLREMAPDRL